jgi:hypothetical protein
MMPHPAQREIILAKAVILQLPAVSMARSCIHCQLSTLNFLLLQGIYVIFFSNRAGCLRPGPVAAIRSM